MKCVNHPDKEANVFCIECGKDYCQECITLYKNKRYCQKCLEKKQQQKLEAVEQTSTIFNKKVSVKNTADSRNWTDKASEARLKVVEKDINKARNFFIKWLFIIGIFASIVAVIVLYVRADRHVLFIEVSLKGTAATGEFIYNVSEKQPIDSSIIPATTGFYEITFKNTYGLEISKTTADNKEILKNILDNYHTYIR